MPDENTKIWEVREPVRLASQITSRFSEPVGGEAVFDVMRVKHGCIVAILVAPLFWIGDKYYHDTDSFVRALQDRTNLPIRLLRNQVSGSLWGARRSAEQFARKVDWNEQESVS